MTELARTDDPARAAGFNSATVLKPWMTGATSADRVSTAVLQFGHGVEAVDDLTDKTLTRGQLMLQFGHGVEAVDEKRWRT